MAIYRIALNAIYPMVYISKQYGISLQSIHLDIYRETFVWTCSKCRSVSSAVRHLCCSSNRNLQDTWTKTLVYTEVAFRVLLFSFPALLSFVLMTKKRTFSCLSESIIFFVKFWKCRPTSRLFLWITPLMCLRAISIELQK